MKNFEKKHELKKKLAKNYLFYKLRTEAHTSTLGFLTDSLTDGLTDRLTHLSSVSIILLETWQRWKKKTYFGQTLKSFQSATHLTNTPWRRQQPG